jgi:hypothetical protein
MYIATLNHDGLDMPIVNPKYDYDYVYFDDMEACVEAINQYATELGAKIEQFRIFKEIPLVEQA